MKTYTYATPDSNFKPVYVTLTEDAIIEEYWSYWVSKMVETGNEHLISRNRCIEDFIVVNWCWEEKLMVL